MPKPIQDNKYKELENRIKALEELSKAASSARGSSMKAAEYKRRTEERFEEANSLVQNFKNSTEELEKNLAQIKSTQAVALSRKEEIYNAAQELESQLSYINEFLQKHPNLEEELENIESYYSTLEDYSNKANTLQRNIVSKKQEVDEIYQNIFGYEGVNEDDEEVFVEGIKDELESSYNELLKKYKFFDSALEKIKNKNEDDVNKLIEEKEDLFNSLELRISSLLPSALTAGLSKAFVDKKTEEEDNLDEHKSNFKKGIKWLVWSAIIPIAINVILLYQGNSLKELITQSPSIMLSILPLYIPLLWQAISANKKMNLSKRLIEEYSHKQVLSMTIEGLSKQIKEINDDDLSEELRIELLTNFLVASKENPGKLISDYEKSDNPFTNILESKNKIKQQKVSRKKKTPLENSEQKIQNTEEGE